MPVQTANFKGSYTDCDESKPNFDRLIQMLGECLANHRSNLNRLNAIDNALNGSFPEKENDSETKMPNGLFNHLVNYINQYRDFNARTSGLLAKLEISIKEN